DFIVRGEGEITFKELVTELEKPVPDLGSIQGLSYRQGQGWMHNPARPLQDLSQINLPDRSARVAGGFHFIGEPMDVAETSRGCPYNCKFCSITNMYGHTFRAYPTERIVNDLKNIRESGVKSVFFIDDNITYNIPHLRAVCQAIIDNKLDDLSYMTQVSAVGIAQNPEVAAEMRRANFRIVLVGFETMDPGALKGVKKPTSPEINQRAAALLRQHKMGMVAACIVGYPDDTGESIARQYKLIRKLRPDAIIAQYMTPYPKTRMREEMSAEGLIVNLDDYSCYDGFTCNVQTRHLSREELYRSLKKAVLRSYFDLSLMTDNHLLKYHKKGMLKASLKSMIMNIYNVLSSRQKQWRFDI
ncbi:MAG: radical SAM protein, partial [Pseudomonadota bacterium]